MADNERVISSQIVWEFAEDLAQQAVQMGPVIPHNTPGEGMAMTLLQVSNELKELVREQSPTWNK